MQILHSLIYMLAQMAPYILLGFLIAGVMHAFIPRRTMVRYLAGKGWSSVAKAALLGIPLPLCSCGVLPTAIAMRRGGASKAASTSFLIATPQTGVDSIAATWAMLGPAFAIVRPVAALVTALVGGIAVGRTEKTKAADNVHTDDTGSEALPASFGARCLLALRYGFVDLVGSIGGWLVAGLVIAALISVYVPADFFAVMGRNPLLSMLAVLVVAVPMYVCATGSIPIAMSLVLKGLSPGTALVLLMAGPAANFASFTLISREMGRKAAIVYLASIATGAIAFGMAVDYLLPASWFVPAAAEGACHAEALGIFPVVCSAVLVALLAVAFAKRFFFKHKIQSVMTKEYTIKGMNCPHCQAAVSRSIGAVAGVKDVEVDLAAGKARVEGEHHAADVVAAVRAAGFDAIPEE